jgi:hypothetical protein
MTVSNSSISNSELQTTALPVLTGRRVIIAGLWTLLWLMLIDISLNSFFAMPKSPLVRPNKLQSYFDFGRSVEGKLRRLVGPDKESTAVIAYAGWLVEADRDQQPLVASSPGQILVAAYGQSFTNQICEALKSLDPRFELRLKAGPAATLSHSYAFYKIDSSHQRADIVVLGILASSLLYMMAPTTATINFEGVAPYTYPVYSLKDGRLSEDDPIIHSLEELRTALRDNPVLWNEFLYMLQTKAPTYNSWIFESDWFDYSTLGRLIRRGIGQKHIHDVTAKYWNTNGFTNADGLLDVANALVADFVTDVKARGQIPYVLLIQDKGYKDHLALAFEAKLKQLDAPYLSTHLIAPSTNARNFVSDGHFTPEVTMEIARAFHTDVLNKLHKNERQLR